MAEQSTRVIVTLAPGVQIADHAAFERAVLARTAVKVTYAAAVSERMYALNVQCESDDPRCVRAKAALQASGLFTSVTDDRRRGGY